MSRSSNVQNESGARVRPNPRIKGTISASDDGPLEDLIALYEEVVVLGGAMVFLGVGTEVALLIWPVSNERLASILANIFVGAGVFLEVLFARLASLRQGKLLDRSKRRLALAREELNELWFWRGFAETQIENTTDNLADAQRKLGQALERAANAELETEQLRQNLSWRRLSKSEKETLLSDLSKACGPVTILYGMGDFELELYALQFAAIFTLAKWAPVMRAVQFDWLAFGLRAPLLEGDPMNQPARTLRAALQAAGMEFEDDPLPFSGMSRAKDLTAGRRFAENQAQLFVGPKEYPYAWPEEKA